MKLELSDFTEEQLEVLNDLKRLVAAHMDDLSPVEMIALFALMIGTIAFGSKHQMNNEEISNLIMKNVDHGMQYLQKYFHERHIGGHA